MMTASIGGDHEKVSVNIREIENGFLINRSWCEVSKNSEGEEKHEYKDETYFVKGLPTSVMQMFKKGKNVGNFGGSEQGAKELEGYDKAEKDYVEFRKNQKKEEGEKEE